MSTVTLYCLCHSDNALFSIFHLLKKFVSLLCEGSDSTMNEIFVLNARIQCGGGGGLRGSEVRTP